MSLDALSIHSLAGTFKKMIETPSLVGKPYFGDKIDVSLFKLRLKKKNSVAIAVLVTNYLNMFIIRVYIRLTLFIIFIIFMMYIYMRA